jgi:hypothetical protein
MKLHHIYGDFTENYYYDILNQYKYLKNTAKDRTLESWLKLFLNPQKSILLYLENKS